MAIGKKRSYWKKMKKPFQKMLIWWNPNCTWVFIAWSFSKL